MKALVLAGGESRRFGRDKALAPWRPDSTETFAERAHRVLSSSFEDVYLSCRSAQAPGLPARFTDRLLLDASLAAEGPGAGLRAAQDFSPRDDWFVLACDYPFVDEACVRWLTSRWSPNLGALVFQGDSTSFEPLIGIWSAAALAHFRAKPVPGPRSVLHRIEATALACPEPSWLRNVNTPGALSAGSGAGP
jgi:molybdopterin-guanine dinucleotide biosynthesis protein A